LGAVAGGLNAGVTLEAVDDGNGRWKKWNPGPPVSPLVTIPCEAAAACSSTAPLPWTS